MKKNTILVSGNGAHSHLNAGEALREKSASMGVTLVAREQRKTTAYCINIFLLMQKHTKSSLLTCDFGHQVELGQQCFIQSMEFCIHPNFVLKCP